MEPPFIKDIRSVLKLERAWTRLEILLKGRVRVPKSGVWPGDADAGWRTTYSGYSLTRWTRDPQRVVASLTRPCCCGFSVTEQSGCQESGLVPQVPSILAVFLSSAWPEISPSLGHIPASKKRYSGMESTCPFSLRAGPPCRCLNYAHLPRGRT